jgi:hypothetical protein
MIGIGARRDRFERTFRDFQSLTLIDLESILKPQRINLS